MLSNKWHYWELTDTSHTFAPFVIRLDVVLFSVLLFMFDIVNVVVVLRLPVQSEKSSTNNKRNSVGLRTKSPLYHHALLHQP